MLLEHCWQVLLPSGRNSQIGQPEAQVPSKEDLTVPAGQSVTQDVEPSAPLTRNLPSSHRLQEVWLEHLVHPGMLQVTQIFFSLSGKNLSGQFGLHWMSMPLGAICRNLPLVQLVQTFLLVQLSHPMKHLSHLLVWTSPYSLAGQEVTHSEVDLKTPPDKNLSAAQSWQASVLLHLRQP